MTETTVDFRKTLAIYCTAAYTSVRITEGERVRVPTSPVHAKAMGTSFTACGVNALTWVKFYGEPFWGPHVDRCTECVAVLGRGTPAHFVPTGRRFPTPSGTHYAVSR